MVFYFFKVIVYIRKKKIFRQNGEYFSKNSLPFICFFSLGCKLLLFIPLSSANSAEIQTGLSIQKLDNFVRSFSNSKLKAFLSWSLYIFASSILTAWWNNNPSDEVCVPSPIWLHLMVGGLAICSGKKNNPVVYSSFFPFPNPLSPNSSYNNFFLQSPVWPISGFHHPAHTI